MSFQPKPTKRKVEAVNKSLYLPKAVADQVDKLAAKHQTSFNNMVVSMIEYCLSEMEEQR